MGSITNDTNDIVHWLFDEHLPLAPEAEQAGRLLFLDTLGCAIGGGSKPEVRQLSRSMAQLEPGPVQLPGMGAGLSAPAAAGWSAMAATWDEACEGLARAHGRPGLHAFPAAVALTLAAGGSLGQALHALVRGYEIGGRLGERLRIGPGRHVDGMWGTFGAVGAACSAMGHDAEVTMATIEAAACQTPMSLYLPVAQGVTVRNTYVAEATRRAINLTVQIGCGVTAPTGALETAEELGLYAAPGAVAAPEAPAPPGEWLVTQGYLKPFAAVRHVHYGAEAARRWLRQTETPIADIDAIELLVYPEAVTYCGNRSPQTAIGAQFSLTYGVAHMLVSGNLGPDAYTDESLAAPETIRLERAIRVTPQPGARPEQRYATLGITTSNGERQIVHVDRVPGDEQNPMTVEDVVDKFVRYSSWLPAPWSGEAVAEAIIEAPAEQSLASVLAATG